MRDVDILMDIFQDRMNNQRAYNEALLYNRNPEIRNTFTEARDDETRAIFLLQQKIEKQKNRPNIIERIFSSKDTM